ncbi:MAG: DinB family protein [Bryobacteraceae bacterium]
MIPLLQSLFAHQVWADDAILKAIAAQAGAFDDAEIRKWLHHIVIVQRFFLSLFLQRPFLAEREQRVPETIAEMEALFKEAHADGIAYAARLDDAELARTVDFPRAPEFHPSIRDAAMQVVMHSEHHRGQCAMRLRALGGKPPVTDYIMWVREVGSRPPGA